MPRDVDPALIERARAGDRAAFRAIVETYGERMYHLALGHLRDHHGILDRREGTVKGMLFRALRKLRRDLAPFHGSVEGAVEREVEPDAPTRSS